MIKYILLGLIVVLVIGATLVRMTPIAATDYQFEDIQPLMTQGENGRFSVGQDADLPSPVFRDESPQQVAARLKDIIEATPRTTLLAGWLSEDQPQSVYRASYVTRSGIWGFPDVTSVKIEATNAGTSVSMHGRLVYGKYDFGVNEARVRDWLGQLTQ
ncbi:DUF1499 domain-containing protein [Litoreibacter janthinus]|uniref:DUF1499 domain-containing protein n=1 Tax=Litoreibacter janthinus TaxID=670154 RepID=A0A1I6GZY6_9RHOB|nr:DUF1499 domain-containing protein [Litoreibacter janthinus]SFR47730.1 Protein of unknown function [Litoreibacter janthinus]